VDRRRARDPSGLARLFIARFPKITAAAKGTDWTYAGRCVEMLGLTCPNHLPYAFADWDWDNPEAQESRDSYWRTIAIGAGETVHVPLPPPNPFATPGHDG